jgi:dihydropteroate synthase
MYPRRRFVVPLPQGRSLVLGDRTLVMGILNVTPDSFADGGVLPTVADAVEAGVRLADEGADIIDIGGESTRPGARPVSAGDELARVLPVIERLAARVTVPLSIDTYKSEVAEAALRAGASIVNDISGLRYEPALREVAARGGAALILMHMRGHPGDMYREASYHDVMAEVLDELRESVAFAAAAGVSRSRLIVDPGVGFAKQAPHSFEVVARLHELAELGCPVLVGPSRKSFLTRPIGEMPPARRDWATAAAVTTAILAGAHVVRVHAVEPMVHVARVADEIRRYHAYRDG